jgi:glycosyltransferase involved in cell wall biosynthesis
MNDLPPNVSAHYRGSVKHDEVDDVFRAHDLFLFPTRGENFGHVILESMRAGTPVLIADTTPWRGLEALGVGWDLPLDDPGPFVAAIETACSIEGASYARWRERVQAYAARRSEDSAVVDATRRLFLDLIGGG